MTAGVLSACSSLPSSCRLPPFWCGRPSPGPVSFRPTPPAPIPPAIRLPWPVLYRSWNGAGSEAPQGRRGRIPPVHRQAPCGAPAWATCSRPIRQSRTSAEIDGNASAAELLRDFLTPLLTGTVVCLWNTPPRPGCRRYIGQHHISCLLAIGRAVASLVLGVIVFVGMVYFVVLTVFPASCWTPTSTRRSLSIPIPTTVYTR